jgi:hypothetical protein
MTLKFKFKKQEGNLNNKNYKCPNNSNITFISSNKLINKLFL